MRNYPCRHTGHSDTRRHVIHYHCPGSYRSSLAYMNSFHDAHRRTNINLIINRSPMKIQTPNSGKMSKVHIVTNHRRGVDHHRSAVQQQKTIADLCCSGNIDVILLSHSPSDKPRYPPPTKMLLQFASLCQNIYLSPKSKWEYSHILSNESLARPVMR